MLIELPKEYSGEKIIESFKQAATFLESPTRKWQADTIVSGKNYRYHPQTKCIQPEVAKMSAWAYDLKKNNFLMRVLLWEAESWFCDLDLNILLEPLKLQLIYQEVDITTRFLWKINRSGDAVYDINPTNPEFKKHKPTVDNIIDRFFENLK